MKTAILKFLPGLFLWALLFGFCSCNKSDTPPPPNVVAGVKDSTLLIKSIKYGLSGYNEDVTEFYDYDSINRKITLTWEDSSGEFLAGSSLVLNYNVRGLLIGSTSVFPAGYIPGPEIIIGTEITYDAQDVLQSAKFKKYNGTVVLRNYAKINLTAGYQLEWTELLDDGAGNYIPEPCKAVFNNSGLLLWKQLEGRLFFNNAPSTPITYTDSLVYDSDGSIKTIFQSQFDSSANSTTNITLADFLTRETKGDNLYNQRRALLNGIANIPFDQSESLFSERFGILSILPSDIENKEYNKFPFTTASVYNNSTGQMETYNAASVRDVKNRLTKFTGFFHDLNLIPAEYTITYFK